MPTEQDQYEVCIDLVRMAGTEYTMQTNITHYEDMMQLEDDILCFLPTTPKQFESLSIRVEKLLTGLSMQHLCSGMWRLLKESSM